MNLAETIRNTPLPERIPGIRQVVLDAEARFMSADVERKMRTVNGSEGYSLIIKNGEGTRWESEVFLKNGEKIYKVSFTEIRHTDWNNSSLDIRDEGADPRVLLFSKSGIPGSNRIWRLRYSQDLAKSMNQFPIRSGIELLREVMTAEVDQLTTQRRFDLLDDELRKAYSSATLGWNKYLGVPADDFAFIPITIPNLY